MKPALIISAILIAAFFLAGVDSALDHMEQKHACMYYLHDKPLCEELGQ